MSLKPQFDPVRVEHWNRLAQLRFEGVVAFLQARSVLAALEERDLAAPDSQSSWRERSIRCSASRSGGREARLRAAGASGGGTALITTVVCGVTPRRETLRFCLGASGFLRRRPARLSRGCTGAARMRRTTSGPYAPSSCYWCGGDGDSPGGGCRSACPKRSDSFETGLRCRLPAWRWIGESLRRCAIRKSGRAPSERSRRGLIGFGAS